MFSRGLIHPFYTDELCKAFFNRLIVTCDNPKGDAI
jgi:hypothetical protein